MEGGEWGVREGKEKMKSEWGGEKRWIYGYRGVKK